LARQLRSNWKFVDQGMQPSLFWPSRRIPLVQSWHLIKGVYPLEEHCREEQDKIVVMQLLRVQYKP